MGIEKLDERIEFLKKTEWVVDLFNSDIAFI